jgi:ribosomal protein L11 methyltransferase
VQFVEIAFTVPSSSSEAWADALVDAGAGGVEERDGSTLLHAPHGRATLVVWIAPGEVDAYLLRVGAAAKALPEPVLARRDRDEDEWRDAWKKHFGVLRVPPFVIVPSWEKHAPEPGDLELHLDPGRAFGTGGHASTRLCLSLVGERLKRGAGVERFLDVGCGSGVLSIAAAKAFPGARGVGVDVDPDAIEVSRENAERNRVAGQIDFSVEPLASVDGRFDLILANIQPDVLIPFAPSIEERLAAGGTVILSGILVEAAPPVVDAYRARGLRLDGERDEDGWRALLFVRS